MGKNTGNRVRIYNRNGQEFLLQSITPKLVEGAKNVFVMFIDIIKNNAEITNIICTNE